MKIKEVAKATGLTEKTIRYYEHRGLVIPESKELNGRSFREYSPEDVAALRAVSTLRKARFPVEEIARRSVNLLLDMMEKGAAPRHILVKAVFRNRDSVAAPRILP